MDDKDLILIDRYLAGDLSPAERIQADTRRRDDPAFDEAVRETEQAIEAVRIYRREEVRRRLIAMDNRLDTDNGRKGPGGKLILLWLFVGAALLAGAVLGLRWIGGGQSTQPLPDMARDSIPEPQKAPEQARSDLAADTARAPSEPPGAPLSGQKPWHKVRVDGPALFAEYYEPYRDMAMDPDSRGMDDPTTADRFEQLYWAGRYREATDTFPFLPKEIQVDDRFRFRFAYALMATGEFEQAKAVFRTIHSEGRTIYSQEKDYALALIYVHERNYAEATRFLKKYLAGPRGKNTGKAESLLKRLLE